MNGIRFTFALDEQGNASIRPLADGIDVLTGYGNDQGLDPERLLPPLSHVLFPTRTGRDIMIGVCSCGETGCGSLSMRVRRIGEDVIWEPTQSAPDETLTRSYRFAIENYLDALDDAAEDRPGEGRGSKVARQVRLLLGRYDQQYDSLIMFHTAGVDWISAWPWASNTVKVSITHAGNQTVHEYNATLEESDKQFAARIAADVAKRRMPTGGP